MKYDHSTFHFGAQMHRAQGTGHQKELVLALGKTFAKFFSRFGWVGLSRNFAQNLGGSEAKFDSPALSENFAFRSLAPLYIVCMYVRGARRRYTYRHYPTLCMLSACRFDLCAPTTCLHSPILPSPPSPPYLLRYASQSSRSSISQFVSQYSQPRAYDTECMHK